MPTIVDYNLKMKDILEDYFQMIDEFDLITNKVWEELKRQRVVTLNHSSNVPS